MSVADRDIFADDVKLMHLCEDLIHQIEQMDCEAVKDPEKSPTPSKLIEIIRYEGDPEPLTQEEYDLLVAFMGNKNEGYQGYASWKDAFLAQSMSNLMNDDGSTKPFSEFD
jgi:hypothetical protein